MTPISWKWIFEQNDWLRRSKGAAVFTVSLALFTDMLVYGIIVPILPDILLKMGRGKEDLGILVASYAIGLFTFTPVFGILSDKYHSRKVPMLLGLLGLAVATILFALADTFWELFLARLAQGISGGASWSIGLSMIADIYPTESLGAVMGTVMGANVLGQLLGPAIGGLLYQHVSYRAPFYFCVFLALLDFMARLWVIPPVKERQVDDVIVVVTAADPADDVDINERTGLIDGRKSVSGFRSVTSSLQDETIIEASTTARMPILKSQDVLNNYNSISYVATLPDDLNRQDDQTATAAEKVDDDGNEMTFWQMLVHKELVLSCLATIAIGNLYSALEPTLPIHFKSAFGSDETSIGLLFTSIVIPNVIMSAVAGHLSDRLGRKLVSGVSMIVLAMICPLIALPRGSGWGPICLEVGMLLLLGGVTAFAITPVMPDMAEVVKGGNSYGKVYALFNMAYSVGMITGPIIGIAMYDLGFAVDLSVLSAILIFIGILTLCIGKLRPPSTTSFVTATTEAYVAASETVGAVKRGKGRTMNSSSNNYQIIKDDDDDQRETE